MRYCRVCQAGYRDDITVCPEDGGPTATNLGPKHDPLVGRMVGSYRLTRLLGTGGMGTVYAGEHPAIGSRVAVKFLHSQYAQDRDLVARFFNEAKAVNIIRHDNIVQALDYLYLDDEIPCLVMEYLDQGYTLAKLTGAPQPLSVVGPILLQVADALAAAHERHIVHRDLKPDNIFLTVRNHRKHFVKLMDFGIAKMHVASTHGKTQSGTVMGTASYMSPEQARGNIGEIGPASDIYSLGVIMYALATGREPFDGPTSAIIVAHMEKEPVAPRRLVPGVPAAYEQIILRCLAKKPQDRFASMRELANTLHSTMTDLSISGELPPSDVGKLPIDTRTVVLPGAAPQPSDQPQSTSPPPAGASSVPPASSSSVSSAGAPLSLTGELRKAHVQLVERLNSLKGRGGVDAEVKATLLATQAGFATHVKQEDEQLYPVLRKQAAEDPRLRTTLALLGKDLDETAAYVGGFFERCLALGPTDKDALEDEVETVFAILMARLWKEENTLFVEYDKIKGKTNPGKLIDQLKVDHAAMVDLFQRARDCNDAQQARGLLFSARAMLVAHIRLEDAEFYPVLRKHAEKDAKLKATLDLLAREMAEISSFASGFFDRCTGLDDDELAAECEQFATILMARMWKEENILFPRYSKLTKPKRDVVEECLAEHRALREALDAIKTLELSSSKGREQIARTRQTLLEHTQREDKAIIAPLKRVAEQDEGLRQTLLMFEADLEDLNRELLELFERVAGGNTADFAEAYGGLLALMKARMKREETILFPRFSKLITGPPQKQAQGG